MGNRLKNKKIILGVTGSIAAYKSAYLTRALIQEGAIVKIIMTSSATDFISPLTLSTLSQHPVMTDFFEEGGNWNEHVSLGLWADSIIIAPTTANTMAKMATGMVDNMLMAVYLSAKCPVFFAPAMDLDMWKHPSTVRNLNTLISQGDHYIPVEYGELASGLEGDGRMAEPESIISHIVDSFQKKKEFNNKSVLITAGPTHESIDPVRFIGNRSTGKMGAEIALELADRGAKVELILGPSNINPQHENISITRITSAEEMKNKCINIFPNCDIGIMSAAVADFTPLKYENNKIKKSTDFSTIELKKTADIAHHLGQVKTNNQCLIGFALETDNEITNAKEKIKRKNFNFIVLNSLNDKGAGFAGNTNKVTIIHQNGTVIPYELKSKKEVAQDIVNEIAKLIL